MTNNKQQTAVDLYRIKINSLTMDLFNRKISGEQFLTLEREYFERAKEMEKAQSEVTENTSDGYHTFKELYEFRKAYNVALFNEWGLQKETYWENIRTTPKYNVHKSWRHNDGELCFGGGWFIVVAVLPTGQISNHYKAEDWDLFQIPETEKALFEFDGHTTEDVIERLLSIK
jgi:hypothetical protein